MNQILLTDNDNIKRKNDKRKSTSNSNDLKKIIVFFAIVIIVFGIAIGGIYGYRIYKNNKKENVIISAPQLSLEETDESIKIIAKSEIGIDKIIYSWNEDEEVVKEVNGRTSHEEKMDIPEGNNELKIKIIDINGQETEKTKEFTRQQEIDNDKITINVSVIENEGKLRIVATSLEAPIKYISYKWNEEDEIKVEAQNEEDTSLETTIDIKRGLNTVIITAEDVNGNSNNVSKNFNGKLKPEIEVYTEGNKLYMKVSHDKGFEKVEFTVNGIKYTYDENTSVYDPEKTSLEYYFDLVEGENTLIIKATSTEGTETEYSGRCNYTAQ